MRQKTSEQASVLVLDPDAGEKAASADVEPQASSVRHFLQEAVSRLRVVTDTPRVEAEVLMMHVLGVSRGELLTHPKRSLTDVQLTRYQRLVSRRASDYPLPYLIGSVEFYGLDFEVTPEVMIPRPETEALVDLALEYQPSSVVDVGTGSGCIAVALATHVPEVTVYGIDVSPAALAVARRNVDKHGLDGRVRLMVGDVLNPRPSPVDLIVSNPPYVSTREWASLPASVRHHEPRIALNGGEDGLSVIRELLAQAQGVLQSGGAMLIEIGARQGEATRRLSRTFFPQAAIRVHPDLAGRDRVLEVQT